jgi:hypothetical protein
MAEIILGGPSMYLPWQTKQEFAARAAVLERFWVKYYSKKYFLRPTPVLKGVLLYVKIP